MPSLVEAEIASLIPAQLISVQFLSPSQTQPLGRDDISSTFEVWDLRACPEPVDDEQASQSVRNP